MATTHHHSGSLKRNAPPLATFRAPASSSTSTTASNSPTVASISSQPPSSITLPRPGILKPPSMKLERHEATTSTASGLYPDVTPSGNTTAGCGSSSSSGVCAVPNCPPANCGSGGGRPSTTSTTSLIRHQTTNGTSETTTMAFNSSCQQCIAERAAVGSTNSAINSTISKMANNDEQQQQLDITQGLEFTSLHSDDGLDALTGVASGEEPRGPRPKISEPGRTYECEIWCRDASRQVAGCLGFTALILTYAALGAFLFMAIESRTAFNVNPEAKDDDPFLVEPPTVMNVTAAFLEMPKEMKANVEKARSETVAKLWQVTEQMNILYPDNWTRIASEQILWFQDQLTKSLVVEFTTKTTQNTRTQASQQFYYNHGQRTRDGPFSGHQGEWTFGRGFLYSISLLTTVGCGHDWAVSSLSRLLTVLYLLVGLPVMYLYLSSTGHLLARVICISMRGILVCTKTRSQHQSHLKSSNASSRRSSSSHSHNIQGTPQKDSMSNSEKLQQRSTWQTRSSLAARSGPNSGPIIMGRDGLLMGQSGTTGTYSGTTGNIISDFNKPNVAVPICGCLFLVTIYIFSGAAVIAKAQNWAYFDAIYYCFISLSTIGFGGIRLEEDSTLWVCALYLLFGMTILSTCCHILHQEVTTSMKKYRTVKRRNRLLLTEIEANKVVDNTS